MFLKSANKFSFSQTKTLRTWLSRLQRKKEENISTWRSFGSTFT